MSLGYMSYKCMTSDIHMSRYIHICVYCDTHIHTSGMHIQVTYMCHLATESLRELKVNFVFFFFFNFYFFFYFFYL